MTVDDVMQWLKSLGAPSGAEGWTMARMDVSGERLVGVWQRPERSGMQVALGKVTRTLCKHIQLLVHWTRDAHATELAAQELYDAIADAGRPTVGGHQVDWIDLMTPEPVDVGADDAGGVFERAIWLDIYYEEA